jgi:D-serine deaminase-like pyridoxal phosphate-dependent protein
MAVITAALPANSAEAYALRGIERVLTPALAIHRDRVAQNIATTLRLLDGDASRWRPHVKTAKLAYTMRMLREAGVRQFKCATTLELATACEAGAEDVLVAYPVIGPSAERVRAIARQFPAVAVSVLVDNATALAGWHGTEIGIFVDVNPGMNRTGVEQEHADAIVELARAAGAQFRGVHYYDGHLSKYTLKERMQHATHGYERLLAIVAACEAAGVPVPEVITAGTPALPCSLAFALLRNRSFAHRVSPGTVLYCDTTALAQLPPDYGYVPAVVVATRVMSQPAPNIVTCDAGHKTVSADSGVPTCAVLGRPELEPLTPSEEHLPLRVTAGEPPRVGDVLYLVPRHVCPTVNNFDHALIAAGGAIVSVERVTARGREYPLLPAE